MPSLNGYGTLTEGNDSTSAEDNAAETFVTEGLSKVLKINNICDADHLADCGIPNQLTTMKGDVTSAFPTTMGMLNSAIINVSWNDYNGTGIVHSYSQLNTKAAAFETQNGESIAVYYNPNCMTQLPSGVLPFAQHIMCANFVYDLNGNKGPNTVGKDIGFMTVFNSVDPVVVAPVPLARDGAKVAQFDATAECKKIDIESRLPNRNEMFSVFINRELVGMRSGVYWTAQLSVLGNAPTAEYVDISNGHSAGCTRTIPENVRCVKR